MFYWRIVYFKWEDPLKLLSLKIDTYDRGSLCLRMASRITEMKGGKWVLLRVFGVILGT